ncbi:2-oxoisovalerate dehydrogenase E2 component (dihydrolipoyl transacylase) [Evansella caseinilytica]|uniref:Dihydrolipoamide acetyltransferase component of pyruvate dehydrogenase complex n=1 Tax=Evansella caseinilytica TaxID=1503961 RepID=A0A1H3KYW2_9BACI|nr:dihydrolipoamide acetyltransferase family protein [Evansella caseinilytica]SDY57427.1 2-oxoisovalerate dehydrogenase E2 component (dihydrolipoyl transacylase) [Evansella caseinilytica]
MATEITMPQLGESVTEGTITKWLVKPGDKVNKYDPLAEVMTDKVNAEIPSSFSGTIKELIAQEDQTLGVGEVICTLVTEAEGQAAPTAGTTEPEKAEPAAEAPLHASTSQDESENKRRYSPAVMRLAQENNIDLEQVQGSGRGGRITRKDLLAVIASGHLLEQKEATSTLAPAAAEVQRQTAAVKTVSVPSGKVEEIPVSGVRRAIANNMVKSKQEAPHAWMMIEVDVTELVRYRNKIKEQFSKKEGIKLTFLPFFVKAVVDALKEYPEINSMWAGEKIIRHRDIHISLAVATETELYVPVIKHADEKSIKGLAKEMDSLVQKVRTKSLKQEDMTGGTFTVNNTGSFGSIQSQPIINQPQAAILSVEAIVKRPVVLENDAIAVRHMVNLCMSLDHRVLDGLICGKFLGHIKNTLENIREENTPIY